MQWTDIATWIGPTTNRYPGGLSTVMGVVAHIQQGSEGGTEAWQKNPASKVSSHFESPKVGRGRQMVDTRDAAWAQADGNAHWLSIEFEGMSGDTLTPDQIEFGAQVLAKAHTIYNVPLQVTGNVNSPGLGHHSMGGVPWGKHPDCPGDPIIAQKPLIVARAAQILGISMTENLTPVEQGEVYNADAWSYAIANMLPSVRIANGDNPVNMTQSAVPLTTFLTGLMAQSKANGAGITDLKTAITALAAAVAALQATVAGLNAPIIKWPQPPVTVTWTATSDSTNQ